MRVDYPFLTLSLNRALTGAVFLCGWCCTVSQMPREEPTEEFRNLQGTVVALIIIIIVCALGLGIDFLVER